MNELKIFEFEKREVRTQLINNEPWLCLKDVCDALDIGNVTDVKNRLNPMGVDTIEAPTVSGSQQMIFINEGNLYKVIFQSRKPEAEKFQDWVTGIVLPEIRKTGGYGIPKSLPEALEYAAKQARVIEAQAKVLEAQKPAIAFYEAVTDSRDALPMDAVAKLLNDGQHFTQGRNILYKILREKKVLRHNNQPYQEFLDRGYFRVVEQKYNAGDETRINIKTLVFQKGINFIIDVLKSSNLDESEAA